MKGTKLILSAIILASLAACSTGDGARKQRDFCYQEGTFHNICKTGADTTGTSSPNDNGKNNNNKGNDNTPNDKGNDNNKDKGNDKDKDKDKGKGKDKDKDCNCAYGGSYDE
mgnify:CR=1 FL=1